jgi:hypothetical protein
MADLARLDEPGQRADLLVDRRPSALLRRIELGRVEHRHVALRPVDLIEVDAIGAQAREARVDRLGDHVGREIGPAVANPFPSPRTRNLAGNDDALAAATREPAAEVLFRAALGGGLGRHRIHLGGIDEVDALLQRVVELRMRVGFAVLLAPRHRAEADLGNVEVGARQCSMFHRFPCRTLHLRRVQPHYLAGPRRSFVRPRSGTHPSGSSTSDPSAQPWATRTNHHRRLAHGDLDRLRR